jgi:hypothetical protein
MIVCLVILVLLALLLYIAVKTRWIYTLLYKVHLKRHDDQHRSLLLHYFQVDEQSTAYGGELVADVLKVSRSTGRCINRLVFFYQGSWHPLLVLSIWWSHIANTSGL